MKNLIRLTLAFLLLSTSLFADVPIKTVQHETSKTTAVVIFSSLPSNSGIDVKMKKGSAGTATVIIYDQNRNVLRKDVLSNSKGMQKGYVLNQLDNGDYTIEVTSNKKVITKAIHVYEEGKNKMFIIKS